MAANYMLILAIYSMLLHPMLHCSANLSQDLNNELDRILVENKFEDEMIDYTELQHTSQKLATTTNNAQALNKLTNLLTSIAHLKFAIKSKFVNESKKILRDYEQTDEEEDLVKAKLIIVRAWVRCKITILLESMIRWIEAYKVVAKYGANDEAIKKLLSYIKESNLSGEPFNLDLEFKSQEKALDLYKRIVLEDEEKLDSDREILTNVDSVIDNAFKCNKCASEGAAFAWTRLTSPLATEKGEISSWLREFVGQMIDDSKENLSEDIAHWRTVSLIQLEMFRKTVLSNGGKEEEETAFFMS